VSVDQTSAIIGVLNVALVIFVETLRHQLDRSVQGHAFATNVVEHCYRELTTLGIVEFSIFIIHKTAPWADGRDGSFKLSIEVEEKFAQAHITLFLTAVLYAFHMCLIAFISFHLSGRWNEIEKMELDHYIEVRHAFERIKEDLKITACDFDDMATLKDKTALYLWSPIKARRYDRLLEQIRFHELRAYFLAANNLPKDFQLSVYLNQCQCNVLIHLVELSTSTWMFLLIILTLFFYFATMEVSLNTASEPVPNLPITGFLTFEGGCCFVLALGILLKFKMDSIYKTMMYDPEMMQPKHVTGEQPPQNTRFQIDLFWKRNPYLIITFYQYMSFMYAVGASVLLLYGADFSGNVLFITILTFLLSYLLNLGLVSYFMPRFTLCVSVGQLTDRATLNEALSDHRLKKLKEKAKKKRAHPHHASKSSSMTLREKTVHFIDKHIRKSSNESGQSEASFITPPAKPPPPLLSQSSPQSQPHPHSHQIHPPLTNKTTLRRGPLSILTFSPTGSPCPRPNLAQLRNRPPPRICLRHRTPFESTLLPAPHSERRSSPQPHNSTTPLITPTRGRTWPTTTPRRASTGSTLRISPQNRHRSFRPRRRKRSKESVPGAKRASATPPKSS